MINEIFIYETTFTSDQNLGNPIPSMKVKGDSGLKVTEETVVRAYQLLEPQGAKVGSENGGIWSDWKYNALVPTDTSTALLDFVITQTKDGGVDLQGSSIIGPEKAIDYIVRMTKILQIANPNLVLNDQPGYMNK